MISFRCQCGHQFHVPDDQAGSSIQCPECGLLNDVPLLGDLNSLEDDGTFRLQDDVPAADNPADPLKVLEQTFTPGRVDSSGREIDLRSTRQRARQAGEPAEAILAARSTPPRYDPETGELIRPLELAEQAPPPGSAMPPINPVLRYSTQQGDVPLTPVRILAHLFQPANLIVMLIVLFAFVVAQILVPVFFALLIAGSPMLGFAGSLPAGVVRFLATAHYGAVIDEIACGGRDQLPRPLRDLNWRDDIWSMFLRMFGGFILCFWPVFLMAALTTRWPILDGWIWVVLVAGICFLPSVWLILIASGSILNLRPDRVVRTIWRLGPEYLLLPPVMVIGVVPQLGTALMIIFAHLWLSTIQVGPAASYGLILLAVTCSLAVGVYAMHFFCWHLASLYRRNDKEMPWIWQEFERTRRETEIS